jgi:hypothetical protein
VRKNCRFGKVLEIHCDKNDKASEAGEELKNAGGKVTLRHKFALPTYLYLALPGLP